MNWKNFLRGLLVSGLIFLSPIAMALVSWALSGFDGSPVSEGGAGHGAYLWFFFFSAPTAVVGAVISLVVGFATAKKS